MEIAGGGPLLPGGDITPLTPNKGYFQRPSRRRPFLAMVLASLVALAGLAFVLASPLISRSPNGPVIATNFQDPGVLEVDRNYWAFAGVNGNPQAVNVLVATSPDFSSWSVHFGYDALPRLGSWAASPGHVWAPDVVQLENGKFVLYYSASVATAPNKHCVGAATASNPEGPYIPEEEPLFCDLGAGGAIDADGFNDPQTNRQYVVYKVDGNSVGHGGACANTVDPIAPTPLILQEVSPDDGYSLIGSPVEVLLNEPSDGPNIEAPSLTYDSSSRRYILFYSSRCFATDAYQVRYATSTSITGPYTKHPEPFLQTGTSPVNLYAPGGLDLTKDGRKAVFHGDLNMGWFHNDGTKRVRAMYAIDLAISSTAVQPGEFY